MSTRFEDALREPWEALAGAKLLDFSIELWDGTILGPGPNRSARFKVMIKDPKVVDAIGDELSLAEAFINGRLDVDGDLEAAYPLVELLTDANATTFTPRFAVRGVASKSSGRPYATSVAQHSKQQDRKAVRFHYDLSNEFFALWLDSRMVYSCAYFDDPAQSLESAQRDKLDYICRKLRLKKGDHFLDVGCGWGALVIHAAQHFGVHSRGITLSIRQAKLARERIRELGLSDACSVDVCDYRELGRLPLYDKIASVGMVEHVGQSQLTDYFTRLQRVLQPGGAMLNHGIVCPETESHCDERGFIATYVFPDGELPGFSSVVKAAELGGLEPRDAESLREHYALTLRHWVRRLEAQNRQASQLVGEKTYRVWRLFMALSAYAFAAGRLNVYAMLLAKPHDGESGFPLTRADWYARRGRLTRARRSARDQAHRNS